MKKTRTERRAERLRLNRLEDLVRAAVADTRQRVDSSAPSSPIGGDIAGLVLFGNGGAVCTCPPTQLRYIGWALVENGLQWYGRDRSGPWEKIGDVVSWVDGREALMGRE